MAIEQALTEQPAPAQQQAPQEQRLSEDEENDLTTTVAMAEDLIDQGGFDVINKALEQSKDPAQVIGQFLMQLGSQIAEQMPEEVKPSPNIFLARGGWLEQVSDFLQEEYDVPRDIMDRAEIYVATAAQQMARGGQQAGAPQQPQVAQQQPQAAPQPGVM